VGNLGLKWHEHLPSSGIITKTDDKKEKEKEEEEEEEKEERLYLRHPPAPLRESAPEKLALESVSMPASAAGWLSKNMAASSSYKKPSGGLNAWAASKGMTRPSLKSVSRSSSSSSSRSVAPSRKSVDPKKAELEKKRRFDMKSLRMRTQAEERARMNPRERFKKRNSLNSESQFRRLVAMPAGEEPAAVDEPATEIDRYTTSMHIRPK
jgi:hypothetical protein